MDRTQRVKRRHFLRSSGRAIAGLAGLLAGQPPAAWAARELSLLTAVNYAPTSDVKLAELGKRFAKLAGASLCARGAHRAARRTRSSVRAEPQAAPRPAGTTRSTARRRRPASTACGHSTTKRCIQPWRRRKTTPAFTVSTPGEPPGSTMH